MPTTYRAGSVHLERSVNHIIYDLLNPLPFCRITAVVHDAGMEVPVSNVTENAGK